MKDCKNGFEFEDETYGDSFSQKGIDENCKEIAKILKDCEKDGWKIIGFKLECGVKFTVYKMRKLKK